MLLLSVLFNLQNCVSVFWILIFTQDIWGNVHYVPWGWSFSKKLWKKSFISQAKQIKGNLRYTFVDKRELEDNNAKISISPNITWTLLLFKASAFLQIFFPRSLLSWQVLRTSVFVGSKCLTSLTYFFLYYRTSIKNIK